MNRMEQLLDDLRDLVQRELDAMEDDLPDEDFDLFLSDELGVPYVEVKHSCPHGGSCDIHG